MYSTLKSETFSPVQVKEIQVKTNLSKIQFIACPENEIKITWHDTSKRTTKANLTGDTLHIEDIGQIRGVMEKLKNKDDYNNYLNYLKEKTRQYM